MRFGEASGGSDPVTGVLGKVLCPLGRRVGRIGTWAAVGLLAAACAQARPGTGVQAPAGRDAQGNGGSAMIEEIRKVCDGLTAEKGMAKDLAASLGTAVEDSGAGMPLRVGRPGAPWREARVQRDEAGRAESVELVPAGPGLRLPAFRKAFGAGREVPMLHPADPVRVAFELDPGRDRAATCTIFVALENDGGPLDQATVLSITVRRDPR